MSRTGLGSSRQSAFTLIEVLIVVAVIALLLGIMLPALAGARDSGRSAVCLSNLRELASACWQYADENHALSPAIGQPYTAMPAWPAYIQSYFGELGPDSAGIDYSRRSILICPAVAAALARDTPMVRTYAINATGHAGLVGDPDDYASGSRPACILMEMVPFPSGTAMFVESAGEAEGVMTPPGCTAAMIDFRQESQVTARLARIHGHGRRFDAGAFDSSARACGRLPSGWTKPLP